jgi:signal transduction histidine kinase
VKEIEIIHDISEHLKVHADRNMLHTIMRNLISNAIKFSPRGGKVSLSAKTTENGVVEISVKDKGIGMSQFIVDNLFRLDVRTGRPGTEGELSTGLGLLLCKEFIEEHGGQIRVESEVGKGSVFTFNIPNGSVEEEY